MVVDEEGNRLGVMTPEEARRLAAEKGLDLVEVAPNARPPVCRIMDYGRFKYEQRKRSKKQHQMQTKIIKLRPKTDPHDLETKLRHARRFLENGDRVRFVVRMRGRERAVTDRWVAQLNELVAKLEDVGSMTGRPQLEGGGVTATVEPRKDKETVRAEAAAARAAAAAQRAANAPPGTVVEEDDDDDFEDDDDLDDDDDDDEDDDEDDDDI
ncbi:MAG: translation initiation factor IF-3 [Myxococcales bacterium]|nr:translation initiation factor IF-3 [Myxococcales bacterium]MCB9543735.1 translation initiation factor IF-3 [Myxococcales bacterium]MCB9552708.1 translation initiation factor IF-3 [Myxococcales bacterium]